MMAVCRGKLSEGYNFENNLARAVLIVGYPLIDFNCLEYRLQEHMNEKGIKEWYYTHAAEAINQAAGRLIRSLKDFGCLYLIGELFSFQPSKRKLSQWIRESTFKEYCKFTEVVKLTKLFMDHKRKQNAFDGHKYV